LQKRSKFLTVVLSCIPGVGHLYLGLMTRGFYFMVAFFGWITFVGFLTIASSQESFVVLLLVLPILWFYSFFDALHLRRKIVAGEEVADISPINELTVGTEKGKKSKVLALVFSFIPGAGHMYLGYKEQGLQLMAIFFFSLFVMDWLHMTFLIFLIPIIWFYSMFDALQKSSQSMYQQEDFVLTDWLNRNHRVLAYLLIGLGVLLILSKFVFGVIMWQYNEYIQTVVVSLLLIAGGIKLLRGRKLEVSQGVYENHLVEKQFEEGQLEEGQPEEQSMVEEYPEYEEQDGLLEDAVIGAPEEDDVVLAQEDYLEEQANSSEEVEKNG
jgi:TM2 domain-containing membrane protein YozV